MFVNPFIIRDPSKHFRFWDWSSDDTGVQGVPDILKSTQLEIKMPIPLFLRKPNGPTEQYTKVLNPLAFYTFGTTRPQGFANVPALNTFPPSSGRDPAANFDTWNRTYRWPTNDSTPTDDYKQINE